MTTEAYIELRARLRDAGYGGEYEWAQSVQAPADALAFFSEYGWVVVNSGMKNQVAEGIWRRVTGALTEGRTVASAFGHPGKAEALQRVYDGRDDWFARYVAADDKMAFLAAMPWIGPITKWHLAKNFGVDCAKPDRHLVRLAARAGTTVDALCQRLATAAGDRVATVDLVLWRGANLGWLPATALDEPQ